MLERRLREEAPSAGGPGAEVVARVMSRVGATEPGDDAVYPSRARGRAAAVVGAVVVGLSVWGAAAMLGGGGPGAEQAAPPAARLAASGEVRLMVDGEQAPVERALMDEGRAVVGDALRLRDALTGRLASLERAAAGLPRGG